MGVEGQEAEGVQRICTIDGAILRGMQLCTLYVRISPKKRKLQNLIDFVLCYLAPVVGRRSVPQW